MFNYIAGRLEKNNPPSQREIARHFGLAQNSVYQLISYLKKKDYLAGTTGHRGLRLSKAYLDRAEASKGFALIGSVAAGVPILAEENIEGHIDLNELFGSANDMFVLRVAGDSMVDAGIMDGDFAMVKPTSEIANGQIAVVLINDEATVKKVYVRKNQIALEPANKTAGYKTIIIKKGDKNIRIIGKVTGCFRKL